MDNMTKNCGFGCLAIALFSIFSIVVSIAVGVFFGAGFGLLSYALFIVFALVCELVEVRGKREWS